MGNKMEFDYSKLRGRIVEKFGSNKKFSQAMHITETTLSQKLTGATYFTQIEILNSAHLLDIESGSLSSYFFTPLVKKT